MRSQLILSIVFSFSILLAGSMKGQHPTWQFWEVIDSADVPAGEIDTSVLNREIRYLESGLPDFNVRYIYNLKFNTDRPSYGSGQLVFDWPVEPDSSYLRTWFDTRANWFFNGQDTTWDISGRLSTPPGEGAIFYISFVDRYPASFVFQGAPIYYSGRSYKPGIYAEYGFFIQEVHPIWHPPIVTSTNEILELKGVYPNPFQDQLIIPWEEQMGSHFTVLLYGIDGKLAWSEQVTHGGASIELELGELPIGQYNLVVAPPLQRPFVTKVIKVE